MGGCRRLGSDHRLVVDLCLLTPLTRLAIKIRHFFQRVNAP